MYHIKSQVGTEDFHLPTISGPQFPSKLETVWFIQLLSQENNFLSRLECSSGVGITKLYGVMRQLNNEFIQEN